MKAATKEKVKRYSLFLGGVSAHLVLVFALYASAVGLDLSKLALS